MRLPPGWTRSACGLRWSLPASTAAAVCSARPTSVICSSFCKLPALPKRAANCVASSWVLSLHHRVDAQCRGPPAGSLGCELARRLVEAGHGDVPQPPAVHHGGLGRRLWRRRHLDCRRPGRYSQQDVVVLGRGALRDLSPRARRPHGDLDVGGVCPSADPGKEPHEAGGRRQPLVVGRRPPAPLLGGCDCLAHARGAGVRRRLAQAHSPRAPHRTRRQRQPPGVYPVLGAFAAADRHECRSAAALELALLSISSPVSARNRSFAQPLAFSAKFSMCS